MRRRNKMALGVFIGVLMVALVSMWLAAGVLLQRQHVAYTSPASTPYARTYGESAVYPPVPLAPYAHGWKDGVMFPETHGTPHYPQHYPQHYLPFVHPEREAQPINRVPEPGTLWLVTLSVVGLLINWSARGQ